MLFRSASICKLFFPKLFHVHTFHFGNYPFKTKKYKLIESLFWRLPDQLIAVGEAQKRALINTYRIPENRILKVLNGVKKDVPKIDTNLKNLFLSKNIHVIGSISTLTEQKGIIYLLRAIQILSKYRKDFILLIIGNGPESSFLKNESKLLNIDQYVFFLGWIPKASSNIMPLFDIFVQASLWEAMSIVVLEAMSHGIPSIVTKVGENPFIIKNGINGILVPSRDPDAIAKNLNYLFEKRLQE